MEIDHIFIRSNNGIEAEELIKFGLIEGAGNIHLGQGTKNRRFFFRNMLIEFLWISNINEVTSKLTKPMKLFERLSEFNDNTSPFGICFRPCDEKENSVFPHWKYKPMYLPNDLFIAVSDYNEVEEPFLFYIPFGVRNERILNNEVQKLEVSKIQITSMVSEKNSEFNKIINESKNVEYIYGEEHLMIIEFDFQKNNKEYDFRPKIPLVFKW